MSQADFTRLNAAGLNLQAVFDIDALPADMAAEIRRRFDPERRYRQLILVGHGGRRLWEAVQAAGSTGPDPIDAFSAATVADWLGEVPHRLIYPAVESVGLQALGQLAGWHHASPFMVGINATWGSWYAYRAVALSATDFTPTPRLDGESPCLACAARPCVAACPADALSGAAFSLAKCVAYRKQADSRCRETCLARTACPVGREHRYPEAQIRHTYAISMRMIERHY